MTFFGLKWGHGFLRTGRHNPPKIPRSTPRGPQTSFRGRGLAGRPEFGEPIKTQMQTFLYLIYFSHFIGILRDELRTRPKAVDHLSKYLKEHYDYTELTELYR